MRRAQANMRRDRIDQLGGFGKKRTQVVKDKTKYTRKGKNKNARRAVSAGYYFVLNSRLADATNAFAVRC